MLTVFDSLSSLNYFFIPLLLVFLFYSQTIRNIATSSNSSIFSFSLFCYRRNTAFRSVDLLLASRAVDFAICCQINEAILNISFGGGRFQALLSNLSLFVDYFPLGTGLYVPLNNPFYVESLSTFFYKAQISPISYVVSASGFLGLIAFVYIFYCSKSSLLFKSVSLCFMAFSLSFAFPPTWLLLCLPDASRTSSVNHR